MLRIMGYFQDEGCIQATLFIPHTQLTGTMILTQFSELLVDLGWELLSVGLCASFSHFADNCVSSFTSDITPVGARLLNPQQQHFFFLPHTNSLSIVKQTP